MIFILFLRSLERSFLLGLGIWTSLPFFNCNNILNVYPFLPSHVWIVERKSIILYLGYFLHMEFDPIFKCNRLTFKSIASADKFLQFHPINLLFLYVV